MDELPAWAPDLAPVAPEHSELVLDALPTQRVDLDAVETVDALVSQR
jgi:hypothetical protein